MASKAQRRTPPLPPHRRVADVQRAVHATLERTQERHDPRRVLEALSRAREDDAEGLTRLLEDMGVRTPSDLVLLLQLLTASSSYAALSWARGLPTADRDRHYTVDDVLGAAWVNADYRPEEAD